WGAGADSPLLHGGGGRGELSERRRHSGEDAPYGACCLLCSLAGEEATRAVPHRGRELRERRQPPGGLYVLQGEVCLSGLARDRRAVPPAGAGARRRQTGGPATSHPAADRGARDVCAAL